MVNQNTHAFVSGENQQIQTQIRIRIPPKYHSEPIISRLVSQYGLTVNFAAAMLGANARDDGWFDLNIQGTSQQIRSAQIYLNDLDLEIWYESEIGLQAKLNQTKPGNCA